jgi:EmrB/QacA subfamily drug resistance transporter
MFADRMNQKVAVSVVFVAAMFMTILDTSIINVAIPTIGREFHVSTASVDSVVVGYLVSLAVFIPASGWLGDRLSNKTVLLSAILLFTVASILCGSANSLGQLNVFRIFQGIGGALLAPVGMALMFHAFPPAERIRAATILIVPTTLAPALGPLLGGLFTQYLSWRWVFFVNVPIGAIALVFGLLFLAESRQDNPGRFDLPGFVLAGAGLALLMYGVSEAPARGWSDPWVIVTCGVGLVLLGALVVVELRTSEPMLDLRLYTNHLFASTLTVVTLMSVSFFAVVYLASLFYQYGLGLSPQESGFNVFPQAIGITIGAPIVARRLYPRFGPRRIMAIGGTVVATMMALLATVGPETSFWAVRSIALVLGIGMSGIFIPAQTASFATIPPPKIGRASALLNSQQRLGGAVGIAAITSVVTAIGTTRVVNGQVVPHLAAYHAGFLAAAAVMLAGAGAALVVRDADAAETMRRPEPRAKRRKRAEPEIPAMLETKALESAAD